MPFSRHMARQELRHHIPLNKDVSLAPAMPSLLQRFLSVRVRCRIVLRLSAHRHSIQSLDLQGGMPSKQIGENQHVLSLSVRQTIRQYLMRLVRVGTVGSAKASLK